MWETFGSILRGLQTDKKRNGFQHLKCSQTLFK